MEGNHSSFPSNYVTLKDLHERWIKRKQEEEEEEKKLRKLRQKGRGIEREREAMEGNHSSFPSNYVTLKDLQERWIKRKQEEEEEEEEEEKKLRKLRQEEEEKLRKLRQEEEIKLRKLRQDEEIKLRKLRQDEENKHRKQKEEAKLTPKSKIPNLAKKNPPSIPPSASLHQTRRKKPESVENKPAAGINVKRSDTIGSKSEGSPAISGRRRRKNRRSASDSMPAKESQMAIEIGDKKEKKVENRVEISRKEPTAEIIGRVANIGIDGEEKGRREMKSSGGGYGRLGLRGRGMSSSRRSGMVWVRKTTDA